MGVFAGFAVMALFVLLPLGGLLGLAWLHGAEALLAIGPAGWGPLLAGLCAPPALLFLSLGYWVQRQELRQLRHGLAGHSEALLLRQMELQALLRESQSQNALLREQARLTLDGMALARRQVQQQERAIEETRLQRAVAEWDLTARELDATLVAMFRLVQGHAGPDGAAVPLPARAELPQAVMRLLPAEAEMAGFEVDERFVRQAARYRATFRGFLEGLPRRGPLSQEVFRAMLHGELDRRLAQLPRPDHGKVIDPRTLAAD